MEEVAKEVEELMANITESQVKRDEQLKTFIAATNAKLTELAAKMDKASAPPPSTDNTTPATTRRGRRRGKPQKTDAVKEAAKKRNVGEGETVRPLWQQTSFHSRRVLLVPRVECGATLQRVAVPQEN